MKGRASWITLLLASLAGKVEVRAQIGDAPLVQLDLHVRRALGMSPPPNFSSFINLLSSAPSV